MLIRTKTILDREYANRSDITTLRITEECEQVRFMAFARCKKLSVVIVEASDKPIAIERSAFYGCSKLVMFDIDRPVRFYTDFTVRRSGYDRRTNNNRTDRP